ncbi:MAG TPA: cell division protein SepF [Phycicoccus elongatus]|uniref:cell division protein SepF n=1 Tax=Phycicoccus elongatus TaxID=101689 RepID=UPI001D2FC274|nr:cell division protein SepF [Phycicoccus elongatus]MCB1240481.1 cell division protein SepF [Tetrasphaera sp.]MCB9405791.1 cell division protein SepF [Tetrasphaera sp.]HPK12410.1 cell division protein SepF [Phycicoccus elongatus]
MSGALRKTMVYLGLAEDQGRHDYDYDGHYEEHFDDAPAAPVTSIDSHRPVASVVRQHAGLGVSRITTIHPRTYNEAKTIGENFREGVPVIMNLTDMDDADAKRLVDFAAGLVFGLHGSIERVTSKVFLLSPETLEVNAEEYAAPNRPLFNQS